MLLYGAINKIYVDGQIAGIEQTISTDTSAHLCSHCHQRLPPQLQRANEICGLHCPGILLLMQPTVEIGLVVA